MDRPNKWLSSPLKSLLTVAEGKPSPNSTALLLSEEVPGMLPPTAAYLDGFFWNRDADVLAFFTKEDSTCWKH